MAMNRFYVYAIALLIVITVVVVVAYVIISGNANIKEATGKFKNAEKPHIIFIYADDLGWNDVSMHGSAEIPTPNIDALAMGGIKLHNYYGMHLCTPSRAALLSGQLPIHLGLQHDIIHFGEKSALPIDIVTMPQHLKNLGYSTHMVGKWHLGYMKNEYTPTYRGFDTFFGFYNGQVDYYTYTAPFTNASSAILSYGIDLHNGTHHINNYTGKYATEVFTNVSTQIIAEHDITKPLFLYLAHLAPREGAFIGSLPEQAPSKYIEKFMYIKSLKRRIHAARMHSLDKSLGEVFNSLRQKGILDNSIILYVSDNGGVNDGTSSNYPLRGGKSTLWEGGVRVLAVAWSPLFQLKRPRIYTDLMHVTDWLPTLYEAAGGNLDDLGSIHGISMWKNFLNEIPSPRKDCLLNIDPVNGISAYRREHLKIVIGKDILDGWFGPENVDVSQLSNSTMGDWVFEGGSLVKDILVSQKQWIVEDVELWYAQLQLQCGPGSAECDAKVEPCLFNITEDPCEYRNIADKHPPLVSSMLATVREYEATAAPPINKGERDFNADPLCHDYFYVPWMEPEYATECYYLKGAD